MTEQHRLIKMKKGIKYIFGILFIIAFSSTAVRGQQNFANEAEMKKEANRLFEEDDFAKAFPLFSQLASVYPKDPDYNYRLGVCMLFSFDDKEKPIRFLEYASSKPEVEKEVLYYLAKAYHLNYRFDDAIAKYKEYKKVASSAKAQKLQVDRQIEMCKNGKLLLRNLSDLMVTDKKEMSREDFFRAYDVTGLSGKLLVKPEDKPFKTSLDKKKKESSVIFSATTNTQIFFSSYGDDASKGKDIYTIKRKDNGEWTTPQSVGAPINTEYDEDFPFLHPNGKVLYFCSKGHNSMGGYDIFKSAWNETTFTWGTPVNMDFPINTPDDDILYVTDFYEKQAYFASARSSTTGKIEVYHINVDRKPIDLTFINGTVIKAPEDRTLDLKIVVKDLNNNSIVGIYNSSPTDGTYSMKLPNGGKYLFTIESPSLATQSEVIVLPIQHEFKPIAQEISLAPKKDKLIVKTILEGGGDDSNIMLASNFFKEKARMEVNASESNFGTTSKQYGTTDQVQNLYPTGSAMATNAPKSTTPTAAKPPKPKLSNIDLVRIAKEDTKDILNAAKDAKEQADIALNHANQKNQMAETKTKEVSQLLLDASKASDISKKQAIIAQANEKNAVAQQLNEETVAAFNLAKKLELSAASKQKEADLSKLYAADLEAAVNSPNAEEAISKLEAQQKKMETMSKENSEKGSITESLKRDQENKEKELAKVQRAVTDKKQEMADNETILTSLKADLAKAKKDDLKQGLTKQIAELTDDKKNLEKELSQKVARADQLDKENEGIKSQMALVKTVLAESKTSTSESAAATVANIDKTKLEQKVSDLAKTTTENTNTITVVTNNPNAVITPPSNMANNTVVNNTVNKTEVVAPPVTNKTETIPVNNTNITPVATNNAAKIISTESFNKKYQDELSATAKITVELEREQAKADVLKNWTKALDGYVTEQKDGLKNTTVEQEKIVYTKNIADAEVVSKDLKTQNETAIAKVDTIKKQQAALAAASAASASNPTAANVQPNTNQTTVKNNSNTVTIANISKKYEDDLISKNKITAEIEREQAKSEVYKAWNIAVGDYIVKQKEYLGKTTDAQEKTQATKNIADAQKVSDDVKAKTESSLAKVELLKKQQADMLVAKNAATNATTNPEVKNTNSTQPAVANNTTPMVTANSSKPVAVETINKKYQDELAEKNKITNELEREQAKTEVLKSWNKAVDDNLAKQNEILKTTSNPEEKKLYAKSIEDAAAISKDLKSQTTASVAKVETLKNNNTSGTIAASNEKTTSNTIEPKTNTTVVTPAVEKPKPTAVALSYISSKYEEQLSVSNKIDDELKREQSKLEIYKNWKKEIDANLIKQRADLAVITDIKEKNTCSENIKNAEKKSGELANQTTQSVAKCDELKKQQDAIALVNLAKAANATKQPETANNNPNTNATQPVKTTENSLAVLNKKYSDELSSADKIMDELKKEEAKTEVLSNWNKAVKDDIAKQKTDLNTTSNPDDKKIATQIIADAEKFSKELTEQTKQKNAKVETLKKEQNAVATTNVNKNKSENPSSANKTENNNSTASQPGNGSNAVVSAPAVNDVFETKKSATYTENKPIPLDEKIPEGLVYKVQIGAFAKPIPQGLFEGIKPITGETTKNGYIRYSAGMFAKLSSAQGAKDQIVGCGYKDAFVVAFYNGKRITMAEAFTINNAQHGTENTPVVASDANVKSENSDVASENATSANHSENASTNIISSVNSSQPVVNNVQPTVTNMKSAVAANQSVNAQPPLANNQPVKEKEPVAVVNNKQTEVNNKQTEVNIKQTEVTTAKEKGSQPSVPAGAVYYTVQVGVFSQALAPAKVKSLSEVSTETTPNGYLRYNSGNYSNFKQAEKARGSVSDAGFKDAFVTAYRDGKRISMTEARQAELPGSNIALSPAVSQVSPAVATTEQKQMTITEMVKDNKQANATVQPPVATNATPTVVKEQPVVVKEPTIAPNEQRVEVKEQPPVTKEQSVAANTEKSNPEVIQEKINTAPPVNKSETVVVDSVEEPNTREPVVTNTTPVVPVSVKPTVKPVIKPEPGNTDQTPVANYIESNPVIEPVPPLADSSKQKLISAIVKYNEIKPDSGVVFKVQLGVFKEKVPMNIANSLLKIAKQGIKNYKDENGYTVYILGSFKTYEEAGETKDKIENDNLKDAFVVAFNGGKKISVEEANKLINK